MTEQERDVMQQALDALEIHTLSNDDGHCLCCHRRGGHWGNCEVKQAQDGLRATLAAPAVADVAKPEPVAWTLTETLTKRVTTTSGHLWFSDPVNFCWTPLYTAPQATKVEPMTKHEIHAALDRAGIAAGGVSLDHEIKVARAIEQAHGIGGVAS